MSSASPSNAEVGVMDPRIRKDRHDSGLADELNIAEANLNQRTSGASTFSSAQMTT